MIYLASPYSHPLPRVREQRFQAVCRAAAALMQQGFLVFSPIAHTHPIVLAGRLPLGWNYWERFDRHFIELCCDEVVVLLLDSWRESRGVQAEIGIAIELGKSVRAMLPDSWEIVGWEMTHEPTAIEEALVSEDVCPVAADDEIRRSPTAEKGERS